MTTTERSRTTRHALESAALDTLRSAGVAGLVDAAARRSVEESAGRYRDRLAGVQTFGELLEVGRALHEHERALGNVRVMAQLLAGAQRDAALAATARYCLDRWHAEIEPVVRRALVGSPLALLVEAPQLARTISAGFLGVELYEAADPAAAGAALDTLQRLGVLVEAVEDLGPVGRRAVRSVLRRAHRRRK